ncbi:cyclase family protein [Sporomusa sp.]|uniref:cyclase family protein n=1 Tax=Sporomusa sp. TaxID=2078658 RepID=UPI002C6E8DF9|nr:cyclase family protein [Sporomusa sp.]HWR09098.1 cyclase family protein [Sporomusa sp.]
MKIDLSVTITEEILNTILNAQATAQIPPVAKFGHIGTHFDVMDKVFQLDNTERPGIMFDVSHIKDRDIEVSDIDADKIEENDFVLFHTGCLKERTYGSPAYFTAHPELANTLITYLVTKKVSMIGIDTCGIRKATEHPQADMYCANNGIFVIENLNNLEILLQESNSLKFLVHTYPVNYAGLTGLPCRVIAEL